MKTEIIKPSVLLSVFKRKGAEGLFTKMISHENQADYPYQLSFLEAAEIPLVCFKQDDSNWLLLSDHRILEECGGRKLFLPFSDIAKVDFAIQLEFKDGVKNMNDFTRIVLKTYNGDIHLITAEKGEPFHGIFQMLHYIAFKKKAPV